VRIVTADRTFSALGELLGVPVVLLPSLAQLKREASSQGVVPGEMSLPAQSERNIQSGDESPCSK
jgi:hypothetical protein